MNEMENIFDEAIRKADKCNECGAITARIGGDSVAHWCCNCGAKLKGNYVYAASDIPPRVWDDEKKQYSYLKVSFKSCFDKNETTVQEEVPAQPGLHPLKFTGLPVQNWRDEQLHALCEKMAKALEASQDQIAAGPKGQAVFQNNAAVLREWKVLADEAHTYGAACRAAGEAAGYARGLAEGRERCAVEAWIYYMDTCKRNGIGPDVCPQWCCAAALRGEVKS